MVLSSTDAPNSPQFQMEFRKKKRKTKKTKKKHHESLQITNNNIFVHKEIHQDVVLRTRLQNKVKTRGLIFEGACISFLPMSHKRAKNLQPADYLAQL